MRSEIRESVLKEALKLDAEQHLHVQDQEPGFVQGRFDFAVQLLRHAPSQPVTGVELYYRIRVPSHDTAAGGTCGIGFL
jgi:hypothetical protein